MRRLIRLMFAAITGAAVGAALAESFAVARLQWRAVTTPPPISHIHNTVLSQVSTLAQ